MLLASELARIKVELGYNAMTISALPYTPNGVTQLFEQVVQAYMQAGELNYSATPVAAVAVGSNPAISILTLQTTPTAIQVGDRLVVDQDLFQESAHVDAITSNSVTIALSGQHVGTYPITVEGGESIVRYYLRQCIAVADRIARSMGRLGVKKVDEIEFFQTTTEGMGVRQELAEAQRYWRGELATVCGVPNLREVARSSGQTLEAY